MIEQEPTVYELVGGDAPFRDLVERFYAYVEADPLLRPMFPADLEAGKEHQFLFLTQFFGGPTRYGDQRGHPRLRMRHGPFAIDREARDHWLAHMLRALEETGIAEPAYTTMHDYFVQGSQFLINRITPEAAENEQDAPASE
jgi:hemoglobin